MFFTRDNFIARLCRESRHWLLVAEKGDRYEVASNSLNRSQPVHIRYRKDLHSALFQCTLGMRFSLDSPPAGLYARLLMRNFQCDFSAWAMDIGASCEAILGVSARIPLTALDARMFHCVCKEVIDETEAFHQEIRTAFRGEPQRVVPDPQTRDLLPRKRP